MRSSETLDNKGSVFSTRTSLWHRSNLSRNKSLPAGPKIHVKENVCIRQILQDHLAEEHFSKSCHFGCELHPCMEPNLWVFLWENSSKAKKLLPSYCHSSTITSSYQLYSTFPPPLLNHIILEFLSLPPHTLSILLTFSCHPLCMGSITPLRSALSTMLSQHLDHLK